MMMEEKLNESVLRGLASEYGTDVLTKLVQGTINEKLDILELKIVRDFSVPSDDERSINIRFAIEDDDVNEVLCTVSRYLDSQDIYWDSNTTSFKIRDYNSKVNAVVEELRDKINTLYKENYKSEFETVTTLTMDHSKDAIKGIGFTDILSLLSHSLMLNARSKLNDLEKEHGITGQRGLILLANLIIDSEVGVQVNSGDDAKFLELSVDYRLLDSNSKPVLMVKYRGNYGVVYHDGKCKLNQEQVNNDLEDLIRKVKNEMLINLN
jgi:hypothetical protein|nr:MAG TPA: hypothetical protein [Caudoviricetes sp.]